MEKTLRAFVLSAVLVGCSDDGGSTIDAKADLPRPDLSDHVEAGGDLPRPIDLDSSASEGTPIDSTPLAWPDGGMMSQVVSLTTCNGKPPGVEDCHARLFIDAAKCSPTAPCDKLVVYWSGGEQSCATGTYDNLMKQYTSDGFVAACAQPFSTSTEAGKYPYYKEWDRMNELMVHLRGLPEVKAAWDGTKLLITGVSHGATAPLAVIAANKALRDHAAVWTGSTATAVVLYDGISNTATLEEWTAQQPDCALWHSRFVGRYGDGKPLVHACTNKACFCSSPAHKSDWEADTLVLGASHPASPYGCTDVTPQSGTVLYRFVSCSGGNAKPCGLLGDIIPDEQQKLAHDALASCQGVVASYKKYPLCAHTLCGGKACGMTDSLAWLASQGF